MRYLVSLLLVAAATPAASEVTGHRGGECVPFARRVSGVQLTGDAWTWWDQADGRYARGHTPRVGAVLAFRPTARMPLGHVSVVSRIVAPHIIMVTHSNWSRIDGTRGQVERDVTVYDVSRAGDWSDVRVWYHDNDGLGGSTYPIFGFIYGTPAGGARKPHSASADLSGPDPDIVGAILDTIR